jgi:site-specific recombinase XerD
MDEKSSPKISELQRLISRFLENLEVGRGKAQRTVENYHHYLQRFADFIEGGARNLPADLSLDDVHAYQLFLNRYKDERERGLSAKTQNYHLIALRAFLKYLVKQDVPSLAPEKIDLKKTPERIVDHLTRDEMERLFEAVDLGKRAGLRDRAILETLYSTGLRVGELVSLNRSQVDLERREFTIRGKGDKPRIVFLSERCVKWLKLYLADRDNGPQPDNWEPLFISFGRNRGEIGKDGELLGLGEKRRLTAYSVQTVVRQAAKMAGLGKKVTPHVIRHSFATELLYNGADLRAVQDMLGHASITTTQIYTHSTNPRLRDIHAKFHR